MKSGFGATHWRTLSWPDETKGADGDRLSSPGTDVASGNGRPVFPGLAECESTLRSEYRTPNLSDLSAGESSFTTTSLLAAYWMLWSLPHWSKYCSRWKFAGFV